MVWYVLVLVCGGFCCLHRAWYSFGDRSTWLIVLFLSGPNMRSIHLRRLNEESHALGSVIALARLVLVLVLVHAAD